jgi:hypothetical protein
MFGFDKYTKLGELFYDDVNAGMIQASRKVVKDELARAAGTIYGNSKQAPLQWYK